MSLSDSNIQNASCKTVITGTCTVSVLCITMHTLIRKSDEGMQYAWILFTILYNFITYKYTKMI